jgi:hypothetical protein
VTLAENFQLLALVLHHITLAENFQLLALVVHHISRKWRLQAAASRKWAGCFLKAAGAGEGGGRVGRDSLYGMDA